MDGEEVSQHSKEVAKGSFWSLSGNVLFNLISFFYVVLVARAVSQDDVGLFYLSFSVVSLIAVFDDLGLGSALVRYVPFFEGRNEKGKIRELLQGGYAAVTVSALALTALLWWQADFLGEVYHSPRLPECVRVLSAFLLLSNLLKLNTLYLQSRADIRSQQAVGNVQNLLKLLLSALFIWLWGPTFLSLAAGLIGSQLAAVALSFIPVSRRTADLPPAGGGHFPLSMFVREIIPFGLMLSVVQSMNVLLLSVDKVLLGHFLEASKVASTLAIYSLATALAMVILSLSGSVGAIFLPVMSRLFGRNDVEHMRAVTATAQRWCLFITMPLAIVLIAFPADIVNMLYGSAYAAGAPVLALFSFALLVKSISAMPLLALAAMRLVRLEMKVLLAALSFDVALNLLLIPAFGMMGAAFSLLLTSLLLVAAYHYYASRLFGYVPPPEIYKMVCAGMLALLVVAFLRPQVTPVLPWLLQLVPAGEGTLLQKALYLAFLGALTALSGAVFVYASLFLKCFRKEDVSLVKKVMHKAMMPQCAIELAGSLMSRGVR